MMAGVLALISILPLKWWNPVSSVTVLHVPVVCQAAEGCPTLPKIVFPGLLSNIPTALLPLASPTCQSGSLLSSITECVPFYFSFLLTQYGNPLFDHYIFFCLNYWLSHRLCALMVFARQGSRVSILFSFSERWRWQLIIILPQVSTAVFIRGSFSPSLSDLVWIICYPCLLRPHFDECNFSFIVSGGNVLSSGACWCKDLWSPIPEFL